MQKPTTEILKRIFENSNRHKDGVYTRLYRYLLREDIYLISYQKLSKNKGALTKGIDTDTADGFGQEYVKTIIKELSNNKFTPKPIRREYIKKANGKMRPLGIPSFKDKLVQEVVRNFLEAIYEPIFSTNSHGFRPKRSCHTALKQASNHFKGTRWFIEGDIKGCFDNINHEKLIEILERKIKDSKFINLIRKFLKAGYMENWKYHQTYYRNRQKLIYSEVRPFPKKSRSCRLAVCKRTAFTPPCRATNFSGASFLLIYSVDCTKNPVNAVFVAVSVS